MTITFQGGRRPPTPEKPRLRLQLLEAGVTPPPTASWLDQVPSYPMYLNDRIGDCTCAAAAHMLQAWTAAASSEFSPTDDDVLKAYEAVSGYDPRTGANDNGAVMQEVCAYWRKTGLAGRKVLGFAQVDHTNLAEVRAAIATFGSVYVGVNFPASAMDQFNAGRPWTPVRGSQIEGGHAIHVGEYDSDSFTCVTWGAQQEMSTAWWTQYVEEAWVVVTADWLEANGSSPAGQAVADLGAQFTALTGEPSPFPEPAPAPEPTPAPVPPVPVDPSALDAALATALTRYLGTSGPPAYLRASAAAWLAARS